MKDASKKKELLNRIEGTILISIGIIFIGFSFYLGYPIFLDYLFVQSFNIIDKLLAVIGIIGIIVVCTYSIWSGIRRIYKPSLQQKKDTDKKGKYDSN